MGTFCFPQIHSYRFSSNHRNRKEGLVYVKEISPGSQFAGRIQQGDVVDKISHSKLSSSTARRKRTISGRLTSIKQAVEVRATAAAPFGTVIHLGDWLTQMFQELYSLSHERPYGKIHLISSRQFSDDNMRSVVEQEKAKLSGYRSQRGAWHNNSTSSASPWENAHSAEHLHSLIKSKTSMSQLKVFKEKLRAIADAWKKLLATSDRDDISEMHSHLSYSGWKQDTSKQYFGPSSVSLLDKFQRTRAIRQCGEAEALFEKIKQEEQTLWESIQQKEYAVGQRTGALCVDYSVDQRNIQQLRISVEKCQRDLETFLEDMQTNGEDKLFFTGGMNAREIFSNGNRANEERHITVSDDKYEYSESWNAKLSGGTMGKTNRQGNCIDEESDRFDQNLSRLEHKPRLVEASEDLSLTRNGSDSSSLRIDDCVHVSERPDYTPKKKMRLEPSKSPKGADHPLAEVQSQKHQLQDRHNNVHTPNKPFFSEGNGDSRRDISASTKTVLFQRNSRSSKTPPPASPLPSVQCRQDKPRRAHVPGANLTGDTSAPTEHPKRPKNSLHSTDRVDDVAAARMSHPTVVASYGVTSAQAATDSISKLGISEVQTKDRNENVSPGTQISNSWSSVSAKSRQTSDYTTLNEANAIAQLSLEDLASSPYLEVKDISRKIHRNNLQGVSTDGQNEHRKANHGNKLFHCEDLMSDATLSQEGDSRNADDITTSHPCGSNKGLRASQSRRTHPRIAAVFRS